MNFHSNQTKVLRNLQVLGKVERRTLRDGAAGM